MTEFSSRTSAAGELSAEQLVKDEIARLMDQVLPLFGRSLSAEKHQFLERQCEWAVRFGSDRKSPVISMLGHVGNYWTGAIMQFLQVGPLRPSQLRAIINTAPTPPISKRMLTLNLRHLERDGLIERQVYPSSQAHVEYRLTALGTQLGSLSTSITRWARENAEQILAAREGFDARDDDPWS